MRFVTAHTVALLHEAGRYFDANTRYTAKNLRTMATENEEKDGQYAAIVALNSGGRLSKKKARKLMAGETILTANDFVRAARHAMLQRHNDLL